MIRETRYEHQRWHRYPEAALDKIRTVALVLVFGLPTTTVTPRRGLLRGGPKGRVPVASTCSSLASLMPMATVVVVPFCVWFFEKGRRFGRHRPSWFGLSLTVPWFTVSPGQPLPLGKRRLEQQVDLTCSCCLKYYAGGVSSPGQTGSIWTAVINFLQDRVGWNPSTKARTNIRAQICQGFYVPSVYSPALTCSISSSSSIRIINKEKPNDD